MRALMLGIAATAVLAAAPWSAADAHGKRYYYGPRVSIGFGYPYYYRPFYPAPVVAVGFNVGRYRAYRNAAPRVRTRELYVYPAAGQSEASMSRDRYQCHAWAADEADFDPTLGAGSERAAKRYGRAFSACMEGRGYVVR